MDFNIVQIQTTSVCNASCSICPYKDSYYAKHPKVMDQNLFISILEDLKKNHSINDKLCLYLMNEPFADRDFERKLKTASDMFPNVNFEVSTNMELCTPDRAEKLVEILSNHPAKSEIWVSFHGISKETFEKITKLHYEKTLYNMVNLLKINKGRNPIKIRGLGRSRDGKIEYFNMLEFLGYWFLFSIENEVSLNNVTLDAGTFHNRAGNVDMPDWHYNHKVRDIDSEHPFDCTRLNCLHVDCDGLAISCCMDYNREYILGDLNTQTIKEVVNSDKWKTFGDKARGKIKSEDDFICKLCMSPGG